MENRPITLVAIVALSCCSLAYAADNTGKAKPGTETKSTAMNKSTASKAVASADKNTVAKPASGVAATKEPATASQPSQPAVPAQTKPVAKKKMHKITRKTRKVRPKNLDFRHCLELKDYAAIAKCAKEE